MTEPHPMWIDIFSDVVCPWCFVGKRRLESALRLVPETQVALRWRPFFLNPWVPREGMTREAFLTTKFGSVARYNRVAENVAAAAAREGLVYRFDLLRRQPNTIDCHRLIHWAEMEDKASEMKELLMKLYFTDGADLSDADILVEAAATVGLDAADTRGKLATTADVDLIIAQAKEAADTGIDGVPTFIIGGVEVIFGAQPADVLAKAIRDAAAQGAQAAP